MFSLDDVSLRVSAPQLSQVWASTEFRSNLLASICQRALNQCLPVTSSEPSLWGHRPLQFPCCWTASLLKPETPCAQTNIRNDAPANCSWYGHENKIKPLALITFFEVIFHSLNGTEKLNVLFLLWPCYFWWQSLPRPVLPTYTTLLCRSPELQGTGKTQWLSHKAWPRG